MLRPRLRPSTPVPAQPVPNASRSTIISPSLYLSLLLTKTVAGLELVRRHPRLPKASLTICRCPSATVRNPPYAGLMSHSQGQEPQTCSTSRSRCPRGPQLTAEGLTSAISRRDFQFLLFLLTTQHLWNTCLRLSEDSCFVSYSSRFSPLSSLSLQG